MARKEPHKNNASKGGDPSLNLHSPCAHLEKKKKKKNKGHRHRVQHTQLLKHQPKAAILSANSSGDAHNQRMSEDEPPSSLHATCSDYEHPVILTPRRPYTNSERVAEQFREFESLVAESGSEDESETEDHCTDAKKPIFIRESASARASNFVSKSHGLERHAAVENSASHLPSSPVTRKRKTFRQPRGVHSKQNPAKPPSTKHHPRPTSPTTHTRTQSHYEALYRAFEQRIQHTQKQIDDFSHQLQAKAGKLGIEHNGACAKAYQFALEHFTNLFVQQQAMADEWRDMHPLYVEDFLERMEDALDRAGGRYDAGVFGSMVAGSCSCEVRR